MRIRKLLIRTAVVAAAVAATAVTATAAQATDEACTPDQTQTGGTSGSDGYNKFVGLGCLPSGN